MKKLIGLCCVVLGGFLSGAAFTSPEDAWKRGTYLFLDNAWIAASTNLERRITPPEVLPDPIVTGRKEDGSGDNCFQPYLTVLRDPESGRFRMWYGVPESSNVTRSASNRYSERPVTVRVLETTAGPDGIDNGVPFWKVASEAPG